MLSNLDRSFYSSLLKSKLSLETREILSEVLSKVAIANNKSLWTKIIKYSDAMRVPLSSLKIFSA